MKDWKCGRIGDKKRFVSRLTFLICFLCLSSWWKHAYSQSQSTLEASYRSADALYQDGQYQQAVEKYEQIASSIQNGAVYYNLGNAYFRLGNRGKAILNYERAKRLMPRDKDTNFNLKVAKTQNVDSFDLVKPPSEVCSQIPSGLIIFDRGFNRRKVFEAVLNAGHHILCRAKSNAVFYLLPTVCKRPKPGRPKTYGKRIHLRHLRYKAIDIDNKRCSVASKVVRTKMCPTQVRLVVMRTRSKNQSRFDISVSTPLT